MSNKKTLKFNSSVVKKFNNGNLNKFMGEDTVSGYQFQTPGYNVTVYNYIFDESNGETPTILKNTFIMFDTYPTEQDKFGGNCDVRSDNSSTGTLLGTFTNKHNAYIWGYGFKLNNMSSSTIETEAAVDGKTTAVPLTGDTTIYLISHITKDNSCLVENTEILLADGTTKLIQDITYDDLLLTYDPYLKDWVKEYPALISDAKVHYGKHIITFANGVKLETSDDHAVYNMTTHTFQTIPEVPLDNFYGAYYDKQLGDFVPTKIVSFETVEEEVNVYNVFTPMCGSIISNGMWTSGNYMTFEPTEVLIKDTGTKNWNTDLLDDYINNEKEEDFISNYIAFNSAVNQYGTNMPIQLYMGSVRKYLPMFKKIFGDDVECIVPNDVLVYITAMILKGCFANIKPYPEYCKVRLDDEVIANVKTENTFVFPDTYNEYLDLTDYKTYKAGDTKTIYINTVIVGKGVKNNGR